jgi:hypothetical protein
MGAARLLRSRAAVPLAQLTAAIFSTADNLGSAVKASCGRGYAYRAEGAITGKIAARFHKEPKKV